MCLTKFQSTLCSDTTAELFESVDVDAAAAVVVVVVVYIEIKQINDIC